MLNFYFINIFMLNFIHYFELKVRPNFYALPFMPDAKKNILNLLTKEAKKAANKMMVKLTPRGRVLY